MSETAIAVRLEVALEPDAEATELQDAASQLRRELLELDVEKVEAAAGGPAPPGTRAVEVAEIGTLLVAAGKVAIGPIVQVIQGWIARRASRSVKLTIDGDSIELSNASAEEQRQLLQAFVARHAPDRL
jgi:Effector Associated Constant Component 1